MSSTQVERSQVFNSITQPTTNLVQQVNNVWQGIKDNTSDEDALQFEMLLLAVCSRLSAYSECIEHGFGSSSSGSSRS